MQGSCECGSVVFEAKNPRAEVAACHCGQCRRTSGHVWASTEVAEGDLHILSDDGLVWFDSSDIARRGFCAKCGSSLFWKHVGEDTISIGAGCLDDAADLTLARDIFVEDRGDYYGLDGAAPEIGAFPGSVKGACECGGITLEVTKPPISAWYCHCDQCRKSSGHFWAGVQLDEDGYRIISDATLRWFQSTDAVKKGFCVGCGASVFWWMEGRAAPAVSAGLLEAPTGLRMEKHIFVSEKGAYYTISDDLPQADFFDLNVTGP